MMPPDSDLVGEALRGKREAFDALMLRHAEAVAAYLYAILLIVGEGRNRPSSL